MKIGNVELKNNIIVAPMAGVSTSAFREICLDMGAGLVYTEMISDKALLYNNEKTINMIRTSPKEHPISIQIFGSEVESLVFAAKFVSKHSDADIIDVNMGCPVNKVVKNGSGSALLKTPEKIYDIVRALKDNVRNPITVKIRAGWDTSDINCDKVAKLISSAGADAIAIHGRTRSQMYNGKVNLDYIKMVKEASSIPVIGNGDIVDIPSAIQMFEETHVDGIMVGRGTLGNPWLIKTLTNYFSTGETLIAPTNQEILDVLMRHAKSLVVEKGEHIAMVEMRTHGVWYLKQIKGTKIYRQAMIMIKTMDDLNKIVDCIKTRFCE